MTLRERNRLVPGPEDRDSDSNTNIMELLGTVNEVSKGVSDGTHAEYQR